MSQMTDANASAPPAKPGWRAAVSGNVLMVGLVSLFTDFSGEMINPILPVFIAGLVSGDAAKAAFWVGLSEGIAEATASLLKIFSGRISDKLGKRKVLVVVGIGMSSIVRPAMALASNVVQVVAFKFLDRVGKGIRSSPRDALIGDSVSKEYRGAAFSFERAMDHLGAILGPLVAITALYLFLGYPRWGPTAKVSGEVSHSEMVALRWLFSIALIPGIASVLALFKVREVPIHPADPSKIIHLSTWRQLPNKFYAFVGIVTLFALGNSSDMFLLLYGYSTFGFSLVELILLWILLHVCKMSFSMPGGILSDKFGRRPIIVIGWVVYALVYMGMAFLHKGQDWQFWALFIVYGVYYGMCEGAEKALVADFIPSEHRATAFGIYGGAVGLAALPASLLFGVFWKVIGPQWAFGIGAALAGLASILLMILLAASRKPRPAAA